MADSFANAVRQSHRVVVAYERRVLDAFEFVGEKLGERDLEFQRWWPHYHRGQPDSTNSRWAQRWAWDFLPLNCGGAWWMLGDDERAPGALHVMIEHIIDTGLERWRTDGKHGEPDALTFPADADTVWRARVLFNPPTGAPITEELWNKNWCEVFGDVFGTPSAMYPAASGSFERGEGLGLKASQLTVSVDELRTEGDFREKFVEPLKKELDAFRK